MSSKEVCKSCHLPFLSQERRGSFTSFVFIDMHCQCHLAQNTATAGARKASKAKVESQSCANCGKVIAKAKRAGSLTSMLLVDLRCSCANPKPKTPRFDMQTRFRPPASLTKRRRDNATRMRTRGVTLTKADTALIELKPGDRIGGDFVLIEQAGQGGMGLVYRARHERLARTVALKFLLPSMVSQESWSQFKQEAKLNSILTHPTICQIYDLGLHQGVLPFYAMDYVDGLTLEEIILQVGSLSIGATLEVFIKAAEGLSYAHRKGVVHKDIKPANIMVEKTEDGDILVKILDFGISQLNDKNSKQEKQDLVVGSAPYMSPEQIRGEPLDARSDIYSLGCSIFETLCGEPPFVADDYDTTAAMHLDDDTPLLAVRTDIDMPIEIDAVVQKCMHKEADRRYQNASELIIDLKRIMEDKPLQHAAAELKFLEDAQTTLGTSEPSLKLVVAIGSILVVASALTLFTISLGDDLRERLLSSLGLRVDSSVFDSAAVEREDAESKRNEGDKVLALSESLQPNLNGLFEKAETIGANGERFRNFDFTGKYASEAFVLFAYDEKTSPFKTIARDLYDSDFQERAERMAIRINTKTHIPNRLLYSDEKFKLSSRLDIALVPREGLDNSEYLLTGLKPKRIKLLIIRAHIANPARVMMACKELFPEINSLFMCNYSQSFNELRQIVSLNPSRLFFERSYFSFAKPKYLEGLTSKELYFKLCSGSPEKIFSQSLIESLALLDFSSMLLTDITIRKLAELPNLKSLNFDDCEFTNITSLAELIYSPTIETLKIRHHSMPFNPERSPVRETKGLRQLHLTLKNRLSLNEYAWLRQLKAKNQHLEITVDSD